MYVTILKLSIVETYRTFISNISTKIKSKIVNIRQIPVPAKRPLRTYWFDRIFSQIWDTYEFRARSGTRVVPNPTVQFLLVTELIKECLTYASSKSALFSAVFAPKSLIFTSSFGTKGSRLQSLNLSEEGVSQEPKEREE